VSTKSANILSAVIMLMFAVYVFQEGSRLQGGSGGFPQLISIIIAVASAYLLIRSISQANSGQSIFADVNWPMLTGVVLSWVLFVWLIDIVGFFPMSGIFLGIAAWILDKGQWTTKNLIQVLLYASISSFVLWCVFKVLLGLNAPSGYFS